MLKIASSRRGERTYSEHFTVGNFGAPEISHSFAWAPHAYKFRILHSKISHETNEQWKSSYKKALYMQSAADTEGYSPSKVGRII